MTSDRVLVTQETTEGPKVFLVDTDALEEVRRGDPRLDRLYAVLVKAHNTPGSGDACGADPWSLVTWDMFYEVRQLLAADGRKPP